MAPRDLCIHKPGITLTIWMSILKFLWSSGTEVWNSLSRYEKITASTSVSSENSGLQAPKDQRKATQDKGMFPKVAFPSAIQANTIAASFLRIYHISSSNCTSRKYIFSLTSPARVEGRDIKTVGRYQYYRSYIKC